MHLAPSVDTRERRFPPSIIVCLAVLAAETVMMLLLRFEAIPAFVAMFRNVPSDGAELPKLTQFVLSPAWTGAGLAALVAAMAASLLPWRVPSRLWALVTMAILGLAAITVTAASLYLPILRLTDVVKAG